MEYISQLIFAVLLSITGFFVFISLRRIRKNILLGRPLDRSDHPLKRITTMTLIAFGQKKMFKRPLPAILHLFVYLAFIIVNIEILEILLDGILGTHRLFAPFLNNLYPYLINIFEFFAFSVIVSCTIFLIRRNIIHVNRFKGEEMTSWPRLDA